MSGQSPPSHRHKTVNTLLINKYEKTYQTLREEFSDEEIVPGYVFPDYLDQKEKAEIEEKFKKIEVKILKRKDGGTAAAFSAHENEIIDKRLL